MVLRAIGGALLVWAGGLGLPFVDRLFTAIDPSLRGLHETRSPFLFPSHWPIESFPPLLVQATTLAIAASFQKGRHQTILAAILLIGLSGIAVTAIFGDWLSSLLFVQAQPWRMAWLMAAAAAMALAVVSVELWRRGRSGRLVLAFLALCWSLNTQYSRSLARRDPGALLSYRRVATGAVAGTAIFNSSTKKWAAGPNLPTISGVHYDLADAPATWLPTGNILFAASLGFAKPPTHFFGFGTTNSLGQVADTPNSPSEPSYAVNLLLLPTGQVLETDFSAAVEIYTPARPANPAWAPVITSVQQREL